MKVKRLHKLSNLFHMPCFPVEIVTQFSTSHIFSSISSKFPSVEFSTRSTASEMYPGRDFLSASQISSHRQMYFVIQTVRFVSVFLAEVFFSMKKNVIAAQIIGQFKGINTRLDFSSGLPTLLE